MHPVDASIKLEFHDITKAFGSGSKRMVALDRVNLTIEDGHFISILGDWTAESDPTAPSAPNVLRQTGAFKSPDFPRVIVKSLTFTDVTVRVRCRPEKGETDRACGIVFRAKDSDNYYLTRANALEDNVRLYHVVNGDRQEFASADLAVTAGQWHTLEVTARGTKLGSWIGMISVNAAYDFLRSAGRRPLLDKVDGMLDPHEECDRTPLDQLIEKERWEHLNTLLSDFTDKDRTFVELYYQRGMEADEIAVEMQISLKTVYSKKHKIRAHLVRCLERLAGDSPIADLALAA